MLLKNSMLQLYSIHDLDISNLFHDDKFAYVEEGHGGKPVWEWPIYHFFSLYESGDKNKARKLFEKWYLEQYQKYSNLEGTKGGMKGGSLDKLYKNMNDSSRRKELFSQVIKKRVEQRFNLFDSIKKFGYRTNYNDPIKAFNKNKIFLFGGHHRVAILAVLNYKYVPEVYIFKNNLAHLSFKALRKLNLS